MRPLLKWAGGKRQLLPELRRFYPATFGRYIEPFVGSGAVFFDLYGTGRLDGHEAILIDSNPDLIGCYEMVRDRTTEVLQTLEELAEAYARRGRTHYYEVRDRHFNPAREQRRRADGSIRYSPQLAAMVIYLNRTGYNGLFRLNASGGFNVPAGRYSRPNICDRGHIGAIAEALSRSKARLVHSSFDRAMEFARADDFLYIDPPYAPLSATSSFTAYTQAKFDDSAQRRVQAMVVTLAGRGCAVVVSNSSAVAPLYGDDRAAQEVGIRVWRVPARRAINARADRRGHIEELVISNLRQTPSTQTSC
jgi:DNA adenine methylase